MKLRTVRKLYYTALLALIILAPFGRTWQPVVYCGILICAMVPFLWLLFRFWRCPLCGKMLGRVVIGNVIRCPHCKEEIKL